MKREYRYDVVNCRTRYNEISREYISEGLDRRIVTEYENIESVITKKSQEGAWQIN
jgi:hypothetical protein